MKIIHNKLIRDNIPEIIKTVGKEYKISVLNNGNYKNELKKKLIEEANEVLNAKNDQEIIEEIADVLEIIDALKSIYNIDDETLEQIKKDKALQNGVFDKRLFLEYVIEEDK